MRASDRENFFPTQEFVVKNLRQRTKRNAFVEHMLEFRVASRNRISYDDQVGTRR